MRDFTKLRIYRFAQESAILVHRAFQEMEQHEEMTPGLLLELSQATHQVCAKIGAAHSHRQDLDLCVENLARAKSAAAESMVFLDLCHSMGYLPKSVQKPLSRRYDQLLVRLGNLIDARRPYDEDDFPGRPLFGDDED